MGGGQGADTTTRPRGERAGPWEGLDTILGTWGGATTVVTTAFPKAPAGAGHCCSSPHCPVPSKNPLPSLELKTIQPWHLDPGWADLPVWLSPLLSRVTRPGGSDRRIAWRDRCDLGQGESKVYPPRRRLTQGPALTAC